MSFEWHYNRWVADIRDPDNTSNDARGFVLDVRSRDGGIVIGMVPPKEQERSDSWRLAFLNTEEAQELIRGLQEAIRESGTKPDGTPWQPRRARAVPSSK